MAITSNFAPGVFPGALVDGFSAMEESLAIRSATFAAEAEADASTISVPYIGEPDLGEFSPEGTQLETSNLGLAVLNIKTLAIKQVTNVSFESVSRIGDVFTNSLRRSLTQSLDYRFLQNSEANQPEGLFIQAGSTGFTLDGNLSGLLNAMDAVLVAGGTPDKLIVSPSFYSALRSLTTTAGSNIPLLGTDGAPTLFGAEVILSHFAPSGEAIVVSSKDVFSAISTVALRRSDDVKSGSELFFGSLRAGWEVINTARIAKIALAGS
jgi:HK97 family phage major capsid protein